MLVYVEGSECSRLTEIIASTVHRLTTEGVEAYYLADVERLTQPEQTARAKFLTEHIDKAVVFVNRATSSLAVKALEKDHENRRKVIYDSYMESYNDKGIPFPDYIINIITHKGILPILGKMELYMETCEQVHRNLPYPEKACKWINIRTREDGVSKDDPELVTEILESLSSPHS